MRYARISAIAAAGILGAALVSPAMAADLPAPDTSGWTFTIAPYLWGSGVSGKSGLFGLPPQDIDLSFGDALKHLDGAFMAVAEARNGPFSIGTDIAYTKLGATIGTPKGIFADTVDVTSKTFMGTLVGGYSLVDTAQGHIDAIAGLRVWSSHTSFDFNGGLLNGTSKGDGATWVDPVVGAKFKFDLTDNLYLSGWGMIGGFGVGSKLMWDALAGVGYDFSSHFSAFGGYRALSVDYSHNGFVYDVVQKGPIVGGVFTF